MKHDFFRTKSPRWVLRIEMVLGLVLCASCTNHLRADWILETNAHPTQPGLVLDIRQDALLVAQLVLGGSPPAKPFLHLFGTDGEVLTQGEPTARFPHHRGLFIGWDEVDSALGSHDLWHMDTGTMTVAEIERTAIDAAGATFRIRVEWRSGTSGSGDLLVSEWRTIRVTRSEDFTQVDLHCRLRAERDLTLNGDLQHAGVHFRAHDEVDSRSSETSYLESPAGTVAGNDLHWCRLLFPRGARWYAATLFNAPFNPVEELSQRDYGRFGYFFSRAMVTGEMLSLNYRLRVVEALAPDTGTVSIYEAENALRGGGSLGGPIVSNWHSGFTGSGYVDFNQSVSTGEYLEWSVPITESRSYPASIRYAFGSSGRPLELRVNGLVIEPALNFPTTGGWDSWDTLNLNLSLSAGTNRVRLTSIGFSGANIDHLSIQRAITSNNDGGPPASRSTNDFAYAQYTHWLDTDPDNDGHTTREEIVTGTDPLDQNSVYDISSWGINPANQVYLIFEIPPARVLTITWSDNLNDWHAVQNPSLEDQGNGLVRWTDTMSSSFEQRFYKITIAGLGE